MYAVEMLKSEPSHKIQISKFSFRVTFFSLISLVIWKCYMMFGMQTILPAASDPLQYMGPTIFGQMNYHTLSFGPSSMACSGWPWLDRITLAIGLRILNLFWWPMQYSGPIYCGILEAITLCGAFIWLGYNKNLIGALLFGVLYIFSPGIIPYSTSIGPETGLVAFALLAYILLFFDDSGRKGFPLIAGLFSGFAAFSKATGVFIPLTLLLFLLLEVDRKQKIWRFVCGLALGAILLGLLFSALYGFEQFFVTIKQFFTENIRVSFHGRTNYNNFVNFLEPLSRQEFLPGLSGLLLCAHAARLKHYNRLFLYTLSLLLVLYLVYYVTDRGYLPKPRYVYPIMVFAHLYTAKYLGELVHRSRIFSTKGGSLFTLSFLPFDRCWDFFGGALAS